ncbi:MAG: hypothetical protein EOO93_05725, partial [Pedobacter sp.]
MNHPISTKRPTAKVIVICVLVIAAAVAGYFYFKKSKTQDKTLYAKYIDAYTSGTISKKSPIRVHLTSSTKNIADLGQADEREIFDFSPSIKGKTYWIDAQTIEFRPEEDLKPGKEYSATLNLANLFAVEKDLEEFEFDFKVISPGISFVENGLVSQNNTSLNLMKLTGEISTSDVEDVQSIEKTLKINSEQQLKIKWNHNPQNQTSSFTIDSIKKSTATVSLTWDGDEIGAEEKGELELDIPAKNVFKVLAIKAIQQSENYVLIQCSEPVNVAQDLSGLVTVGDISDLRYTIDGSQIKVYTPDALDGSYNVVVNNTVTNINGKNLESSTTANLVFENKQPAVTISGTGNILPNSGKLVLPFEAVNLKSVDVTIIKIYQDNIPQFFQVNNYSEGNELRRVAKPILQKTIRLDEDKTVDLRKKNRFTLDLDKLFKTEPGAMYRVSIMFKQKYSLFSCNEAAKSEGSSENDYEDDYENGYYGQKIDEDDDFWQGYENYYPSNYSWRDKDDPCTPSYYTSDKWAHRNLLSSNIGLIAKRGNDESMMVIATDLLSAKPLSGVTINLLNYQRQKLTTVETDGNGMVTFSLKKKPFLLVAEKGTD